MITSLLGYDEKFMEELKNNLLTDDELDDLLTHLTENERYTTLAELIGLYIGNIFCIPTDVLVSDIEELEKQEDDDKSDIFVNKLGEYIHHLEEENLIVEYAKKDK